MLVLFSSSCLHHRAFYKMIKHSTDKLNQQSDDGDGESEDNDDSTTGNGIQCDEKFLRDLIEFHVSTRE